MAEAAMAEAMAEVVEVVARAGGAVEVSAGTYSRAQKLRNGLRRATRCARRGLINVYERLHPHTGHTWYTIPEEIGFTFTHSYRSA